MSSSIPIFDPSQIKLREAQTRQLEREEREAPRLLDIREQQLTLEKIDRFDRLSDRGPEGARLAVKLWNADPKLRGISEARNYVDDRGVELVEIGGAKFALLPGQKPVQIKEPTQQQLAGREFQQLTPEERRAVTLAPTERALAGAEASQAQAARARAETGLVPAREDLLRAQIEKARAPNAETLALQAAGGDETSQRALELIQRSKVKGPEIESVGKVPFAITDQTGTYDVDDPNMPENLKPIALAAKRASGEARRELTSSTRTMTEAAPTVIGLTTLAFSDLEKVRPQMGALGKTKVTDIMVKWFKLPNKDWATLGARVHLITTLLMRMHVGARGGEYIMKSFKEILQYSSQSAENLEASLEVIRDYAELIEKKGALLGKDAATAMQETRKRHKVPLGVNPDEADTEAVGTAELEKEILGLVGGEEAAAFANRQQSAPAVIDLDAQ